MKDKKKNIPPMTFGPGTLQRQKQAKAIKELRKNGLEGIEKKPIRLKKKAEKKSAVEPTTLAVPLLGKHAGSSEQTFGKQDIWCYTDDYLEAVNNAYPPDLFKKDVLVKMANIFGDKAILGRLIDTRGVQYPGWVEANFEGRVLFILGAALIVVGRMQRWSGFSLGQKTDKAYTDHEKAINTLERNGLIALRDHEGQTYIVPTFTLAELVFRNAAKNGLLKPITQCQTI